MKTRPYQCNYCKRSHYSLEGVINCPCKFNRKIKWNIPPAKTKEMRALMRRLR